MEVLFITIAKLLEFSHQKNTDEISEMKTILKICLFAFATVLLMGSCECEENATESENTTYDISTTTLDYENTTLEEEIETTPLSSLVQFVTEPAGNDKSTTDLDYYNYDDEDENIDSEVAENQTNGCEMYDFSEKLTPKLNTLAIVKKCCPIGQSFAKELGSCLPSNSTVQIDTIMIEVYGKLDCLVTLDEEPSFQQVYDDSCLKENGKQRIVFESTEDQLMIVQDGRLLVVDKNVTAFLYDDFCIENDESNKLIAAVCFPIQQQVIQGAPFIFLIFGGLIFATAALIFTGAVYYYVPPLNNHFGKLVSTFCVCFLIGLLSRCLAKCTICLTEGQKEPVQRFSDFWFMSSVFVFLLMNVYNFSYAAYYLQNRLEFNTKNKQDLFIFLVVAYIFTIVPVMIPFDRKYTFYIPMFLVTFVSALFVIATYFFLHKIKAIRNNLLTINKRLVGKIDYDEMRSQMPTFDVDRYETVKSMTQYCVIQLVIGLSIRLCLIIIKKIEKKNNIHEVVASYLLYFHAISIFLVFSCWRAQWYIIREWWFNSGSLRLDDVEIKANEMEALNSK